MIYSEQNPRFDPLDLIMKKCMFNYLFTIQLRARINKNSAVVVNRTIHTWMDEFSEYLSGKGTA